MAKTNTPASAPANTPPTGSPQKGPRRHPITGCRVDTLINCPCLMQPADLESMRQIAVRIELKDLREMNREREEDDGDNDSGERRKQRLYKVRNGVGVIEVNGPLTKFETSFQVLFGGTSTVMMEKVLRQMVSNPEVKSILIKYDSPGGTFLGTNTLSEYIAKIAHRIPVISFADGVMASGAYMLGAQAGRVLATAGTQIGSIGTYTVLYDRKEKFDKEGVKVIVVKAGENKAVGIDGTEVTDKEIAHVKERVNDINDYFLNSIVNARGMERKAIVDLKAGVFLGEAAKNRKLIDEVVDEDRAFEIASEAALNPEKFLRKAPATNLPQNSTTVAPNLGTDKPNGSRIMLTPLQLEQAKSLPGAATITAENADTILLGVAVDLNGKAHPPKLPQATLDQTLRINQREIDLIQKDEKITPEQAADLKALIKAENVQSDGSVKVALSDVFNALQKNQPAGLTPPATGSQNTIKRQEPNDGGKTDETKAFNEGRALGQQYSNDHLQSRGFITSGRSNENGNGR